MTLCQTHQVKSLYAFGSSVTDRFDESASDIDLLVEIDDEDPIEREKNSPPGLSLSDRLNLKNKVQFITASASSRTSFSFQKVSTFPAFSK